MGYVIAEAQLRNEVDFSGYSAPVLDTSRDDVLLEWDGFLWFNRFGVAHVYRSSRPCEVSTHTAVGAAVLGGLTAAGGEIKGKAGEFAFAQLAGVSPNELWAIPHDFAGEVGAAVGDIAGSESLAAVGEQLSANAKDLVPVIDGVLKLGMMTHSAIKNAGARREFMQSFDGASLEEITSQDNVYFIPWAEISSMSLTGPVLNKTHTISHADGHLRFKKAGRGGEFAKQAKRWGIRLDDDAWVASQSSEGTGNHNERVVERTRVPIPDVPQPTNDSLFFLLPIALGVAFMGLAHASIMPPTPVEAPTAPGQHGLQPTTTTRTLPGQCTSPVDCRAGERCVQGTCKGDATQSTTVSTTTVATPLDAVCGEGNVRGQSCGNCPTWAESNSSDASSELRLVNSREARPGERPVRLIEVEDHGCVHHTWGGKALVIVEPLESTFRLIGSVLGGTADDCESKDDWLVCVTRDFHHGVAGGVLRELRLDGNRFVATPLFAWADDRGGVCTDGYPIFGSVLQHTDPSGSDLVLHVEDYWGRPPLDGEGDCADADSSWVQTERRRISLTHNGREFTAASLQLPLQPPGTRRIEPAPVDPNTFLAALPDEVADKLVSRRLAALRYRNDTAELKRRVERLAQERPAGASELYGQLAIDCEAVGDYPCAKDAYEKLLATDAVDDSTRFRAAWFFVSTPTGLRDSERARELLGDAGQHPGDAELAVITRAELLLRSGDKEGARTLLSHARLGRDAPRINAALVRASDFVAPFALEPTPKVPPRAFKGPREWPNTVPDGEFTPDELAIALHLHATDLGRSKKWEEAAGFYEAARSRGSSPEVRVEVELGYGKLLERKGFLAEAESHYWDILRRDIGAKFWKLRESDKDRVLNRLAWFHITADDPRFNDVERGMLLAERAAVLTQQNDPSVLDTLAEGYLKSDRRADAIRLLERCVELDPTRDYYARRLKKAHER